MGIALLKSNIKKCILKINKKKFQVIIQKAEFFLSYIYQESDALMVLSSYQIQEHHILFSIYSLSFFPIYIYIYNKLYSIIKKNSMIRILKKKQKKNYF